MLKKTVERVLKLVRLHRPVQRAWRRLVFATRHRRIRNAYAIWKGRGFTCNICSTSYEKFAPHYAAPRDAGALAKHQVVGGYGENIYCPNCMSTARDRLAVAMLKEMVLDGKSVLHLSPERAIFEFVRRRANVVTGDLDDATYRAIDRNVQRVDATRLDFAPESFDLVIANHVLEHIPDDRVAMREIHAVLRPGGQAILQVPFSTTIAASIEEPVTEDPEVRSASFGQSDHVRIYRLDDYLARLRDAGFDVEYVPYQALSRLHRFAIQPGEGFIRIARGTANAGTLPLT